MPDLVEIFVEGIADVKFLNDLCFHINGGSFPKNIKLQSMGGKDDLNKTLPAFQSNMASGTKNVIILDADNDFNNQKNILEELIKSNDIEVDFFLFPDNKSIGDLEILLQESINEKNKKIFECWDRYEKCLEGDGTYTLPARKTKIYGYLEALLGSTKQQKELIKEHKRNYLNEDHWDLNKPYLNPLKEFLLKYI